jgi:hypothetical protein
MKEYDACAWLSLTTKVDKRKVNLSIERVVMALQLLGVLFLRAHHINEPLGFKLLLNFNPSIEKAVKTFQKQTQ